MILNMLLCSLVILATFVTRTVARVAIVGGEIGTDPHFKYQVSLQVDGKAKCGGGIIGNEHILTAGHCVVKENGQYEKHIRVIAGTNNLHRIDHSAVVINASIVYVPEEYRPPTSPIFGDIAVLKLEHPLGLPHKHNLKALELPNNEHQVFTRKKVVIAGWGWDYYTVVNGVENGGNTDRLLRFAEADVISNKECQDDYGRGEIPVNFLCARVRERHPNKPRGTCLGDSGGPLVHNHIVIGVFSRGPRICDEKHIPSVYISVSHYLHFVRNALNDHVTDAMRKHELNL